MSIDDASSVDTYTSISSDSDGPSWGIPLMDVDELSEMDPYEEVTQQGQATPPSPAYVPDPMKLEHHVPVYVSKPAYPEYLALSDDEIPIEDQPLPDDAPKEDPDEDPEEDPADYPADGGDDDDDESSDDDDEEQEDPEEDEEEEEHLAPADSSAVPAIDHVPSAEDTEAFETDQSAATPPPPPPAYRTTSRISVRTHTPIPFPSEAEVDRLLALPTLPPSLLTPLSSPLPQIPPLPTSPTYAQALLEAFETDESAPTPPSPKSPQIIVPPSQTRLRKARNTVRPQTPVTFPSKAEVARLFALPTPPPSPLTPLSSLLLQIPSPPLPVSSPPLPLPSPVVDS
ncbi:hypothetical protein Tco_0431551 [Tanacetum coccineum]